MYKYSVVVCTYNRVNYLRDCVTALLNLDFMGHEIVIVNDGSTDGTMQFLDSLQNSLVKVVHHEKNRGLSEARNTGIKNASGDIVAFTDDDCIVDPSWLTEMAGGFTDDDIAFVIGRVVYRYEGYKGYFPERLVSNLYARWPMGANIAYRKNVFTDCGGFDDFFFRYNNEDSEMAIRVVSKGFRFNKSGATVYHQPMNWTVKSLLNSAKNASVWPILKKRYKDYYLCFGPPVKWGLFVNIEDYLYILLSPLIVPVLLVRYLMHGKRDLKVFFVKWPTYYFLRRYLVYKEAIRHRVWML